eukprot:tig00001408_g8603.t1
MLLNDATLQDIFFQFASFGAGNAGSDLMDGARWVKFLKDCKIVDARFNTTSADIIFNRLALARKLNFEQFKKALGEVAAEKYPGDPSGVAKLHASISANRGPSVHPDASKTATKGNIFDRLTDHTQYTGVYKERFDAEGRGKGVAINGQKREVIAPHARGHKLPW